MIADACAISFHTVHYHIKHIYEKLHLRGRTELALSVTVKAEDDLISGRRSASQVAQVVSGAPCASAPAPDDVDAPLDARPGGRGL